MARGTESCESGSACEPVSRHRWAPVIVRIAGLPANAMDAFSGPCSLHLDSLALLEKTLQSARENLVERLYSAIHDAAPEKRHRLLAVKRDCFNGRPLTPHSRTAAWRYVEEAAGEPASQVIELEERLQAAQSDFASLYETETIRQYRHLASLAEEPVLRCGLAVASPQAAREVPRFRQTDPASYGKKDRRLATTLLRYASRAALKLSPFSTFTPVGLAHVVDIPGPPSLDASGRSRRSLVRMRRHILDRCSDLLLRYEPWRQSLAVRLNDSIVHLEDGRVLFRRPSHYQPREAGGTMQFQEESLVRVRLSERLLQAIESVCRRGTACGEFIPALAAELGGEKSEDDIAQHVGRLIDIGFLHLLRPWSDDEAHVEKVLLRELRRLPATAALDKLISELDRLVEIEETFLDSEEPLAAFLEIDRLADALLRNAAELCGVPNAAAPARSPGEDIYHDVWCAPGGSESEPLVRAGRASLERALASVAPLVRYSRLFDRRVDFLYTLGALLGAQRGPQGETPLLEAFDIGRPLWQSFMQFQVRTRESEDRWHSTWNPSGLDILKDLAASRDAARAGLESCLIDEPEGRRIESRSFSALLDEIPVRFTENHVGGCLFLQPASPDGDLWVLNRLKEGTARFASRYTPLMPDSLQQNYAAEIGRRGTFEIDGEEAELLDVYCVQGDTLNVHPPQTPRVLALPGSHVNVPAARQLHLQDLVVAWSGDGWPRLRDRKGKLYLPVHLGVCYHDYLPTLVKFICAFGPSELSAVFPQPLTREVNGVTVQERTMIGNVLLHRKSWRIPAPDFKRLLEGEAERQDFAALHRWRRTHGIPERVFAVERVPHPILGFRYQPQFVDLTSPVFMPVLRAIAGSGAPSIQLVETLPSAAAFPEDAAGRAWAIELLVDSLAAGPPREFSNV